MSCGCSDMSETAAAMRLWVEVGLGSWVGKIRQRRPLLAGVGWCQGERQWVRWVMSKDANAGPGRELNRI